MDKRLESEEKQQFIAFMRRMLQWTPEDREDCDGVYWDEWLLADVIDDRQKVDYRIHLWRAWRTILNKYDLQ